MNAETIWIIAIGLVRACCKDVKSALSGRYMENANQYFEEYLPGPKRTVFHTRKGLSWRNAWGVLRYSANNAFIAFVHADQMKKQVTALASAIPCLHDAIDAT